MRRFVLLCSAVFAALVVAEIMLRVLPSAIAEQETRRLLTNSRFILDSGGVPRLAPRQEVRSILQVGDSAEFDVTYTTNNLGFVDREDYDRRPDGRALAIVGDSFTAGVEAGDPWLPKLRDRLRETTSNLHIYNFGTGAAGVRQFADLLDSVTADVSFDAIVVLAITDDFYRIRWRPETANGGLYLCGKDEPRDPCIARRPIAQLIDSGAPTAPAPASDSAAAEGAPPAVGLRQLLRKSHLLVLLKRSWDVYGGPRRQLFDENAAGLSAMRARFPNVPIDFVQLPQKHEVSAGRYDRNLRGVVEAAGLKYHDALASCRWSSDLYYERDAHPNQRGYRALSDCVENLVVRDYARGLAVVGSARGSQ